jgi:tetratricopeptide (TPR) repeat protein
VAILAYNLGRIAEDLGDLDGAVERYEEVRRLREAVSTGEGDELLGDELLGDAHEALSDVALERGDLESAERHAARAVEALSPVGGERLAASLCVHGRALQGLGRIAEAREAYHAAREHLPDAERVQHVSDGFLPARIALGLAILLRLEADWEACLDQAQEAESLARATGRPNRELELLARSERTLALVELGVAEEALGLAEESLPVAEDPRYEARPLAPRARADMAWARWNLGQREQGLDELRVAVDQLVAHPAAGEELPALYGALLRRAEAGPR